MTEEQRAAVTALEGPVIIVAGAGTGKTRVIAHRVAYLLETIPDLSPANILALTFSRRAAEELRSRVESLLNTYADELWVSTFHAFCYQLLQDHGVEIGLPRRLTLLGHVEQWRLLRARLPALGLTRYDTRVDLAGCLEGFLRFINRAKDELVGPAEYAAFVREIAEPDERARQQEILTVYEAYQQALHEQGALDFGDLVGETLRLFRERPAVLAAYQDRLRYLLVDEFQDTDVAQIRLLATLAGSARRLCVVGDDDQAIYRFRGASYASFLLFQEQCPEARLLRLTQNYRSTPQILRSAERLIQGNGPDRYDPEKHLWTAQDDGPPAELVVCQDYDHEARVVAARIQAWWQGMPAEERSYRRIAVLYRAHSHRERIAEALHREEIPFVVSGGTALLEEEAIKDVVACLRVLHDPADSVSFFRILGLPHVGLGLSDIVQVTRAAKQQQRTVYDTLRSPKATPLRAPVRQKVRALLKWIHVLQRLAVNDGIEPLMRRLLEDVGYRPRLLGAADQEARESVLALSRWFRFVQAYAEAHPAERTLGQFLDYLQVYQEAGGELRDEFSAAAVDGVQLMTVHQAKGLEFDWVIVPSMVQGRFPSRGRPEAIPFPLALMKERLPSGDFHVQEERRLCYVAMTRARRGLVLTTVDRPYHRPSVFVRELLASGPWSRSLVREPTGPQGAADVTRVEAPAPTLAESLAPPLSTRQLATLEEEQEIVEIVQAMKRLQPSETAKIDAALARLAETAQRLVAQPPAPPPPPMKPPADAKFSFSQLEMYRYCPRKYQYAYVYQIPTRPTAQMQLGTNLHACLEEFGRRLMAGQPATLEGLLALYEETWRPEGYSHPDVEQREKAHGRALLEGYFAANTPNFRPPLFVEKPFLIKVGDAWLRGFIDRIDPQPDGRVEVLDYKSGRPKTEAQVGDRLQLNIYALACRDVLKLTPATLSFYYLQNNEKLSFPYDEAAVEETRQTITAAAQKIRGGDFTPTPDYVKCRACDFRGICSASAV